MIKKVTATKKKFSYYEYKYTVPHEKLSHVKCLLDTMCGSIDPYPSGIVDSIYYDSLTQHSHEQCINGEYYKSKFRIRGYGDGVYRQVHLKIKKMSTVTKYKSAICNENIRDNNFPTWDNLRPYKEKNRDFEMISYMSQKYGLLLPSIRVTYFRHRYRLYDYRITLDTNIEFFSPTNGLPSKSNYATLPHHVLELKTLNIRPNLPFVGLIKLPQISCSKFMLGNIMLNR